MACTTRFADPAHAGPAHHPSVGSCDPHDRRPYPRRYKHVPRCPQNQFYWRASPLSTVSSADRIDKHPERPSLAGAARTNVSRDSRTNASSVGRACDLSEAHHRANPLHQEPCFKVDHRKEDSVNDGDPSKDDAQSSPDKDVQPEDDPSKDVQPEDDPSKDVQPEDDPSKDVPSKDVPSKDVPSKDVPSEHDPPKDVPSQHDPSKDVPSKNHPSKAANDDPGAKSDDDQRNGCFVETGRSTNSSGTSRPSAVGFGRVRYSVTLWREWFRRHLRPRYNAICMSDLRSPCWRGSNCADLMYMCYGRGDARNALTSAAGPPMCASWYTAMMPLGKRFLAFHLHVINFADGSIHTNALLYDRQRAVVERFEPFGGGIVYEADALDAHLRQALCGVRFHDPSTGPLAYRPPRSTQRDLVEICKDDVFEPSVLWCLLYVHLRAALPRRPSSEIVDRLERLHLSGPESWLIEYLDTGSVESLCD